MLQRSPTWPRRRVLQFLAAAGTGAVFARALVTVAQEAPAVTAEMIRQAEWISGVTFDETERELMQSGVNRLLESFAAVRAVPVPNDLPPAFVFRPGRDSEAKGTRRATARPLAASAIGGAKSPERPDDHLDLAFASAADLGRMLRAGSIASVELTQFYLDRLKRHDPQLECVIALLEERALESAARADRDLAAGRARSALHGVPWGAKDLLAVAGAPTTWGARPFRDQVLDGTATAVERLDEAGAVLIAKLALGALAWGDVWYGGTTKSPWNVEEGSSGSSAGSAAATAAGLVGFALGSETWGSIVSPCTRCGATGFRPTFGRVSRHGAMALSWTMDKLGPIARTVEDCALVFDAIHGTDGLDRAVQDRPFRWPAELPPERLKIGYVEALFDEDRTKDVEDPAERRRAAAWQENDRAVLATLRDMGMQLAPIALPSDLPVSALSFILTAEAASAFDDLTRSGRDDELTRQVEFAWPNVFRQGQLIPAVEYLRANRIRMRLIREMEARLSELDVFVCPSFGGDQLLMTNLTGHPAVVAPNGFAPSVLRSRDGETSSGPETPTSITFCGRLHGDDLVLTAAHAWQVATGFHLRRPPVGGREETPA